MIDPHSYDAAYIAGYFEQWVDHVKAGKNTVPTTQLDVEMLEKAIVLLRGPSPLSRSAAAFPADYRKALEASNLPIEVAVAIADRLDARDGTNAGDTPISDSFLRHADRISEALYAPCQYAEDVGMPEYRCSVECQYAPSAEFEECAAALLDFAPHTMDRSVRFRMEQAARLLRQRGPSRPQWRKVEDGGGTYGAIHVTRTELEKEQPLTFWTMYLGEFYECRVYLYPVHDERDATGDRT